MLSKKTQDVLDLIENIYKITQESIENAYAGSMRELVRDAIRKTAEEDGKGYSTVASSLTRGMEITGDGSMEEVYKLLEEALMQSDGNHRCDDLLVYLVDSMNKNDDSEDEIRRAYLSIFEDK